MNTFKSVFEQYDWDTIQNKIYQTSVKEVELALSKKKRNLDDFLALISPAAQTYLEQMAQMSHELTKNVRAFVFE
jgi:2-iminoacetate synthase